MSFKILRFVLQLTLLFTQITIVTAEEIATNGINHEFAVAISKSDTQSVQHLLEEGVILDFEDSQFGTPLCQAVSMQSPKIVQMLIDAGANVSVRSQGKTALIIASQKNNLGITSQLIRAGADVNAEAHLLDGTAVTPILAALLPKDPNYEVVKLLVEKGGTRNKLALLNSLRVARRKQLEDSERLLTSAVGSVEAFLSQYEWESYAGIKLGISIAIMGLLIWPVFRKIKRVDRRSLQTLRKIFIFQITAHLSFVIFTSMYRLSSGWPFSRYLFEMLLLSYFFAMIGIIGILLSLSGFFFRYQSIANKPALVS